MHKMFLMDGGQPTNRPDEPGVVAFGDFELDAAGFELRRAGARVPMEPQSFDVLAYLLRHRDRLVSKEELMDEVWGGRFVSETAVSTRIKQARRAVDDDGRAQRVILTVHGRGYRFIAPVGVMGDESRPVEIAPVSATANAGTLPDRLSLPRSDAETLVGRAAELAALDRLIDDARHGYGAALVVSGEPGIGKTALLDALRTRVTAAGGRVLWGRAAASGRPYRPLAHALIDPWRSPAIRDSPGLRPYRAALDRLVPGFGTPGDEPTDAGIDPALMVAEGILRTLIAPGADLGVLVLDDASDADPDTIAVLEHLLDRIPGHPVLLALGRRDWPESPALDRLTANPAVTRLALPRLPDDAVTALVSTDRDLPPQTVAAIAERAEGLPLVAVELAAAAADGEPDARLSPTGFATLVHARLSALSADQRQLLAAAAVMGRHPDWDLIPGAADVEPARAAAGFRRAVELNLLTMDAGELAWRHGLIRQVVWSTMLPPERRALARAIVDQLVARDPDEGAATAAELLITAGEPDRAAELWLDQARAAMAVGGLRTAAELLANAERTGRRRVGVTTTRVALLVLDGRATDALELGRPVLAEARGEEHAELCLRLARAAVEAGRWDEVGELVARAGRLPGCPSLILLSDAAHAAGRLAEAENHAVAAIDLARREGRPAELCEALCAHARALRPTRPEAARAAFADAAQVAGENGLLPWRVEALFGVGTIEMLLDESPDAIAELRGIALDAGMLGRAAQADLLLADHVLAQDGPSCDTGPATRLAEFGRLSRIAFLASTAQILLGTRRAMTGEDPEDEPDAGPTELAGLPPDNRSQVVGNRALAALVRHDLPRAAGLLNQAMRPIAAHLASAPLAMFGAWVLVQTVVDGGATEARAALAEQTAGLRRANRGAVRYADAVVAARSGDGRGAEEALIDGDALLAPVPWWRRFLRLLVLESAVADGWGDPVPQLRVDLAAFEDAGEQLLARRCRDLLRAAGAPSRRGRGDATVPAGLRAAGVTSREVDVLRLIQGGATNAVIAGRLFLSSRTVETHIAHLLAKSGTTNRADLTAWAAGVESEQA